MAQMYFKKHNFEGLVLTNPQGRPCPCDETAIELQNKNVKKMVLSGLSQSKKNKIKVPLSLHSPMLWIGEHRQQTPE